MSTTRIIVGITVVMVLIIAGYAVWASSVSPTGTSTSSTNSSTNTPAVTPATTQTTNQIAPGTTNTKPTIVTYSNGAFSPASVTIAVGDQVQFENSDASRSVNVASDPHPSHTDFPSLNLGMIGVGQSSAAITFDKAGTFGYHNHLNPTQTGTVIVK